MLTTPMALTMFLTIFGLCLVWSGVKKRSIFSYTTSKGHTSVGLVFIVAAILRDWQISLFLLAAVALSFTIVLLLSGAPFFLGDYFCKCDVAKRKGTER